MLQGTINALTTFNQRRLLAHQVETSFLLKPMSEKKGSGDDDEAKKKAEAAKKKKNRRKKKKFEDSDDESSEEDFHFLEMSLKESAEMDEIDKRLLMGIIQSPAAEKKRWDKEDPAEIRRKRKEKARARGEHYSDSYDEETDGASKSEEDDFDVGLGDGSLDMLGKEGVKTGKKMLNKVMDARNKTLSKGMSNDSGEVVLPCPEGYDALKWAQLSRKEKMKILGISEAEWDKMTREQQMKRMNNLAHGFHFYSIGNKK